MLINKFFYNIENITDLQTIFFDYFQIYNFVLMYFFQTNALHIQA